MKKFFDSDAWGWIRTALEIGLIVLIVFCIIWFLRSVGIAEEANGQCWILCDPESYVTVRAGPGKNRMEIGGFDCGDHLWTDSTEKNGFIHVVDMNAEYEAGWISTRYIVFSEPHKVNAVMRVKSNARVAIRKWIGGKVTGWLKNGDTVKVLWMSDSWAVTTRGYVMSQYLKEIEP